MLAVVAVALLLSSRTLDDVPFRDELLPVREIVALFRFTLTLTYFGRGMIGRTIAGAVAQLSEAPSCVFLCRSSAYVKVTADAVLELALEAETERYGA